MAKILLFGLECSLAEELSRVLRQLGQSVSIAAKLDGVLDAADADLIFAGSSDLQDALAVFPKRPVIVTSRLPEVKAWLSALEDGAADYCGAPFEPTQLRWVLNSALANSALAA
jgi:DNA-binding NtrC family response regulator